MSANAASGQVVILITNQLTILFQLCMAVSPASGQVVLLSTRQLEELTYIDQIQMEGTILDAEIQVI
jgi:hypothetical protein